ncbi:MAG: sodium:proton antiporter [Candidatus Dadabacteria bacterium]|nr:MAG: sodium:proton antiporter [Candidatus Dadabacteria bacterium]
MILNYTCAVLMIFGVIFFVGVFLGVSRFPDCYCRSHASAKSDTLSTALFILAIAIYVLNKGSIDALQVTLKLFLIIAFVAVASPTASHALLNAAYVAGLKPWQKEKEDDSGI